MKCANCSYEFAETSRFCPNCGTQNLSLIPKEEPVVEPVEDFVPAEAAPLEPEEAGESMDATQVAQEPEAGGFVPPIFTPEAASAGKKLPIWMLALGGILVVAVLVILAILIFGSSGGGNGIVIGIPSRNDTMDVFALKLGQDIKDLDPMLEDGNFDSGYTYQLLPDDTYQLLGTWEFKAGFVKDSKDLVISYSEDGEKSLYLTPPNPKELTAIFESEDDYYAILLDNGKTVFIQEDRGGSIRCYVALNGKEAKQVAKGDGCHLMANARRVLVSELSSKDELTLKSYDLRGENEIIIFDDEPNIRNATFFQYNQDGNILVVIVEDGDEARVRLINLKNAEMMAESDLFVDVLDIGLSPKGDGVYFMAENEEGLLELYIFEDNTQKLIASGSGLQAQFDTSGKNLIYLVSDEDNRQTIFSHPMGGQEDVEVMSSEKLSFDLLQSDAWFLIKEEDADNGDVSLFSAKTDGSALTEIFSDSDVTLNNIYKVKESDWLVLEMANQDGLFNLYSTQIDSQEGQYILEDWAEVAMIGIHPKGGSLLLSGAEDRGDDEVLFILDISGKNDPVELDDDDIQRVVNAFFAANGRSVIYTVQSGNEYDDYEIRQVPVSGEDDTEVLYKEAILIDAAWTSPEPFDSIWFSSPVYSSNVCPGSTALSLDATVNERLASDLGETCFRFKAQADKEYTFFALGKDDQDLYLNLVDKDGNYLASDGDSGPGYNPAIFWTNGTEPLTVYIQVTGSTSETLDFDITAKEGTFDPAMASAMLIPVDGSDISGTVEDADLLDLGIYSGPGDLYYFEGQTNQTITIDAMVGGTSSSMDPFIALIDAKQNILESDDNGGTDNDANLTYVLPSNGRYYIIVIDGQNSSGPDYTYTIKVTK